MSSTRRYRRQIGAAFMAVLLLQTSLLEAGVACSVLRPNSAADTVQRFLSADATDDAAHSGPHAPYAGHESTPPDVRTHHRGSNSQQQHGPMHCLATMACTVAIAGGWTDSPAILRAFPDQIAATDAKAPAFLAVAPEPPPPRA